MQIVVEYISMNYMTLMLLVGLIVILIANRRTKIEGIQYIYAITGLVFVLTLVEYMELWCNRYDKPVWILYVKAALSYIIHPLLILLELYFVAPIKHKILLFLPLLAEGIFIISDFLGTSLIYSYSADHAFHSGNFHFLTVLTPCFYILLLMFYSLRFLHYKEYSKAIIVIFMAISTIITVLLETNGIVYDHTTEIAAMEILVYYFYLAAIHHSEVQEQLYKNEMTLETAKADLAESRLTMMLAQIKPHFIYNSMNAIMELCYTEPERAADTIAHFSEYLRGKLDAFDSKELSWFDDELALIKEYLSLEYADRNKVFRVEYDLACTDFRLPALTVQPLVENAVKHGIDRYSKDSLVQLISYEDEQKIYIKVTDNGTAEQGDDALFAESRGIGLSNAAKRLEMLCGGDISVTHNGNGTIAVVTIPKTEQEETSCTQSQ